MKNEIWSCEYGVRRLTLITTIIENEAIRQTFEVMFDYMWQAAKAGHAKLLAKADGRKGE